MGREKGALASRPDELIYAGCYAPIDLRQALESPDRVSRLHAIPPAQLFFELQGLEPKEIQLLLPFISRDQWAGILDLGVWSRDRFKVKQFLELQKHVLDADLAVARKLLWAGESELFELTFKKYLRVFARIAEDEFEGQPSPGEEWLETPDGEFLIGLPSNADRAQMLRSLILMLYEIDAEAARLCLSSCRSRTSMEIEETAYEEKRRSLEDLGFEDYFDAVQIYALISLNDPLPKKKWESTPDLSTLPMKLPVAGQSHWLLLQALGQIRETDELRRLLEELFFVCNKLLSADCVSPAKPLRVKRGINKTVCTINLGLDYWARGEIGSAVEGIRLHYLQSFFQLGHGRLLDLQRRALQVCPLPGQVEPGSYREAALEGLRLRFPLLTRKTAGKIKRRFIRTQNDLNKMEALLSKIEKDVS